MVRRSVPLLRRVRAVRGQILLGFVWVTAVLLCIVLILLSPSSSMRTAIAVIRSHEVRAPESGRVSAVHVTELQHVEAGTILATVEVPGLAQQVAAAEADLRT